MYALLSGTVGHWLKGSRSVTYALSVQRSDRAGSHGSLDGQASRVYLTGGSRYNADARGRQPATVNAFTGGFGDRGMGQG